MGESFGGVLTSYIATRLGPDFVYKCILVNPATSYGRTNWPLAGPLIAATGPLFPVIGVMTLMATAVERNQFLRIGRQIADRINTTEDAVREISNLVEAGSSVTELLSPETLNFRLKEWLLIGNSLTSAKKLAKMNGEIFCLLISNSTAKSMFL